MKPKIDKAFAVLEKKANKIIDDFYDIEQYTAVDKFNYSLYLEDRPIYFGPSMFPKPIIDYRKKLSSLIFGTISKLLEQILHDIGFTSEGKRAYSSDKYCKLFTSEQDIFYIKYYETTFFEKDLQFRDDKSIDEAIISKIDSSCKKDHKTYVLSFYGEEKRSFIQEYQQREEKKWELMSFDTFLEKNIGRMNAIYFSSKLDEFNANIRKKMLDGTPTILIDNNEIIYDSRLDNDLRNIYIQVSKLGSNNLPLITEECSKAFKCAEWLFDKFHDMRAFDKTFIDAMYFKTIDLLFTNILNIFYGEDEIKRHITYSEDRRLTIGSFAIIANRSRKCKVLNDFPSLKDNYIELINNYNQKDRNEMIHGRFASSPEHCLRVRYRTLKILFLTRIIYDNKYNVE